MRYIKDIVNPEFKIGIYQWNNKYIIKIESGMYEQTYKIDDYEFQNIEELESCVDPAFLDSVRHKFEGMQHDFLDSMKRHNLLS